MFASRKTEDVQIDGDDGALVVVTVQKLSGRALENARNAKSAANLANLRAASKDMLAFWRSAEVEQAAKALADKRAAEAEDPKARAAARYDSYDREHVLNAGIVRWTARDPKGVDLPVSTQTIDDLDEASADKLHRAILDLSLPPLDPAEQERALAKG